MAALNLNTANVYELKDYNKEMSTAITTTGLVGTVDATDGAYFTMTGQDGKVLILLQASTADASVSIKAGNGIQGVKDYTFTVASGKTQIITIESGRFKNVTGANKGKVIITYTGASAVLKACVFVLP